MASTFLFVSFILSHLVLLHSAEEEVPSAHICRCKDLNMAAGFPYSNMEKQGCGYFRVDCKNDTYPTTTIQLEKGGKRYEFLGTSHDDNVLHIVDRQLWEHLESRRCESLTNLSFPNPSLISFEIVTPKQTLFKCNSTPPQNGFKKLSCDDSNIYYNSSSDAVPTPPGCSIIQLPKIPGPDQGGLPFGDHPLGLITATFDLRVRVREECKPNGEGKLYCVVAKKESSTKKLVIGFGIGLIVMVLICCFIKRNFSSIKIIYCWKKKSLNQQTVQTFLKNCGPLTIRRYNHSDIKKMTNLFKDKLGEGGFGGVYKGKLEDGCLVAVKVLKESRGNGEEFINEVASISRTSHVNIVSLMGFCFEDSKKALIYEFMPNGSLEKFIYKESLTKAKRRLEWETLYKIVLGIARGLEYLHRGCNTRIVHFDIKPHNILLDENFCPKISDFGLAKICRKEVSIISMLGARGTAGYIAPEVFCRNFGEVSHKSDVYSYGMMVFEMVGGRRNIGVENDHTSETFFPHWIYNRLKQDEDLALHGLMNEEDHKHARKMIIVSLWCIQTNPSSRPPMSRVVSMLEGSLESLQIPPMPFLHSPSRSPEVSSTTMRSELEYDSVMP